MKRDYVAPDALAALTASALFADPKRSRPAASAAEAQPSTLQRLERWFTQAPVAPAPVAKVAGENPTEKATPAHPKAAS